MKAITTIRVEYDIDKSLYPRGLSDKEVLEMDINNFKEDPYSVFDISGSCFEITGKLKK